MEEGSEEKGREEGRGRRKEGEGREEWEREEVVYLLRPVDDERTQTDQGGKLWRQPAQRIAPTCSGDLYSWCVSPLWRSVHRTPAASLPSGPPCPPPGT